MLIKPTQCNKASNSDIYKKPLCCSDLQQQLSCIYDALKEVPKLMTRNWYTWNLCFRGILSNWPADMKHLDSIIAPPDKEYNAFSRVAPYLLATITSTTYLSNLPTWSPRNCTTFTAGSRRISQRWRRLLSQPCSTRSGGFICTRSMSASSSPISTNTGPKPNSWATTFLRS